MVEIYIPTQYIETEKVEPAIFLGGPIQGADDWQSKALDIIHSIRPETIVFSPRREYLDNEFDYGAQVDWETYHLRRAGMNGIVAFWLAKEKEHDSTRSYAQTTRAELFEWKERHIRDGAKLVVGIEDGFSGTKYIKHRFSQDCPDVPILDNLEETCITALKML